MCSALQEGASLIKPVVEEHGDDLYKDLYDDLSVSTVTVSPNVTDYEVGKMQMQTQNALAVSQSESLFRYLRCTWHKWVTPS